MADGQRGATCNGAGVARAAGVAGAGPGVREGVAGPGGGTGRSGSCTAAAVLAWLKRSASASVTPAGSRLLSVGCASSLHGPPRDSIAERERVNL